MRSIRVTPLPSGGIVYRLSHPGRIWPTLLGAALWGLFPLTMWYGPSCGVWPLIVGGFFLAVGLRRCALGARLTLDAGTVGAAATFLGVPYRWRTCRDVRSVAV